MKRITVTAQITFEVDDTDPHTGPKLPDAEMIAGAIESALQVEELNDFQGNDESKPFQLLDESVRVLSYKVEE